MHQRHGNFKHQIASGEVNGFFLSHIIGMAENECGAVADVAFHSSCSQRIGENCVVGFGIEIAQRNY